MTQPDALDLAAARTALAARLGAPPEAIQVETVEGIPATVFPFRGYAKGDMPRWVVGALTAEGPVWGTKDALEAAFAAWGYTGPGSKPAVDAARIAGFLEGSGEETTPMLTEDDWSFASERWATSLHVPKETEVGGHPALQFWISSAEPPFSRVTLVFTPEGIKRDLEAIWDL